MGAVLRTHPVRDELHIQRNAKEEVATVFSFAPLFADAGA